MYNTRAAIFSCDNNDCDHMVFISRKRFSSPQTLLMFFEEEAERPTVLFFVYCSRARTFNFYVFLLLLIHKDKLCCYHSIDAYSGWTVWLVRASRPHAKLHRSSDYRQELALKRPLFSCKLPTLNVNFPDGRLLLLRPLAKGPIQPSILHISCFVWGGTDGGQHKVHFTPVLAFLLPRNDRLPRYEETSLAGATLVFLDWGGLISQA